MFLIEQKFMGKWLPFLSTIILNWISRSTKSVIRGEGQFYHKTCYNKFKRNYDNAIKKKMKIKQHNPLKILFVR